MSETKALAPDFVGYVAELLPKGGVKLWDPEARAFVTTLDPTPAMLDLLDATTRRYVVLHCGPYRIVPRDRPHDVEAFKPKIPSRLNRFKSVLHAQYAIAVHRGIDEDPKSWTVVSG
jgi:hypothetical protein